MKKKLMVVSIALCAATALMFVQLWAAPQAKRETTPKIPTFADTTKAHSTALATTSGISGAVKLCSGVLAPHWRDTITVPDSFTSEGCRGFAASIGTSQHQLGCAHSNSISWGAFG